MPPRGRSIGLTFLATLWPILSAADDVDHFREELSAADGDLSLCEPPSPPPSPPPSFCLMSLSLCDPPPPLTPFLLSSVCACTLLLVPR